AASSRPPTTNLRFDVVRDLPPSTASAITVERAAVAEAVGFPNSDGGGANSPEYCPRRPRDHAAWNTGASVERDTDRPADAVMRVGRGSLSDCGQGGPNVIERAHDPFRLEQIAESVGDRVKVSRRGLRQEITCVSIEADDIYRRCPV